MYRRNVAVKVLKNAGSNNRVKFLQEAAIMAQFNHENVCKMFGVVKDGDPMLLVLELIPNGSLYDYLKDVKEKSEKVTHTQLFKMALDVASAMKYLHSLSFIHRGEFDHCSVDWLSVMGAGLVGLVKLNRLTVLLSSPHYSHQTLQVVTACLARICRSRLLISAWPVMCWTMTTTGERCVRRRKHMLWIHMVLAT